VLTWDTREKGRRARLECAWKGGKPERGNLGKKRRVSSNLDVHREAEGGQTIKEQAEGETGLKAAKKKLRTPKEGDRSIL